MYRRTVLPNGLRLLTSKMPQAYSIAVSFFLGAGSRYESEAEAGISHFLEHLCFKGNQRRPTPQEVAQAIEGVGGILNGGTDKELTAFWCKVTRPYFPLALEVLNDMVRHSLLDPGEVEKERQVIINEINSGLDSPSQRVDMLIDEVLWPGQALGRDVAGSKETVAALSRQQLLDYLAAQYTPDNAVVGVAGDIDHEEVLASLLDIVSDWPPGQPRPWYRANDQQTRPQLRAEARDTELIHLCLGLRGLSHEHPDRFSLDLLNIILGEGMSSRLFLELRERRGLAYDIHSFVSHYRDCGSVIISASVAPSNLETALSVILEELARLRDGVPDDELLRAKEQAKGRLLLRLEDTRAVAGWLGAQELLTDHVYTVDEMLAIADAITPQDLRRVAGGLLVAEKLNLAVVGPAVNVERLETRLLF
ncbi:MAG TPA: insulinase family protein [Dehalococcoidia bacterium]|nr:insulinase family protein [Dehalococcoidia bacterium]